MQITNSRKRATQAVLVLAAAAILITVPQVLGAAAGDGGSSQCEKTARHGLKSCEAEAVEEFWDAVANCDNLDTVEERMECRQEAREEYFESLEECDEVFEARLEICDRLPGPYNPELDPNDFVSVIDNPFLPLIPGTTRIYEATTEDGLERVEVSVLKETKEIEGIECTVVRDIVFLDDVVIEDTHDWFAQDIEGNVWYLGEIALNYEDGELTDIDGSWVSGKDNAKAGIVMPAMPAVGDYYRQEFLFGEAEDMGEVESLTASATVPFGSFTDCLRTRDFTPLESDANENKYYAAGIGVVLEIDLESGERVELIDVIVE